MRFHSTLRRFLFWLLLVSFFSAQSYPATGLYGQTSSQSELTLIVMDPLCDRLACDCVEGYAQRKYEVLADHLTQRLERKVAVFWGESMRAALEDESSRQPDIVIGKHSVVLHEAATRGQAMKPVAQLTGADGLVTQTGLIVVRKNDAAVQVQDLNGYRVFFGPEDCDEKHKAPMALLRKNGVAVSDSPETCGACSEAATRLLELDDDVRAAAVISSYAQPLLSGCGTIEKGDLRVIGVSDEVPFVTAFVRGDLDADLQTEIRSALLTAGESDGIKEALQTASGFVPYRNPAGVSQAGPAPGSRPDGQSTGSGNLKKN